MPFHVRVQRELDEYAETLKAEKAKKERLENVQTIRSRQDPDELDDGGESALFSICSGLCVSSRVFVRMDAAH